MADQVFPYHLAGFAIGALATGYSIGSLKQYFTRRMTSTEKTTVDPNLPPPIQTRKRKRDPDVTSLPPTKRRVPDAVNTPLSAHGITLSDGLNTPSPFKSVKVTSNLEQNGVEVTIGNVSSRPAHFVRTRSSYGVKLSYRGRKHHTKHGDSNKANEEDYHSDRTMIGDNLEHHDDGSDDSNQNGRNNNSVDLNKEDDDFDVQVGEGSDVETHEEEGDDFADHAVKKHGLQYHDEDDADSEDDEQGSAVAYDIGLYRQNAMVDLKISIPTGRSNDLEIMVQNRQPSVCALRRRRQGKL